LRGEQLGQVIVRFHLPRVFLDGLYLVAIYHGAPRRRTFKYF
jgi:hypothetical protein